MKKQKLLSAFFCFFAFLLISKSSVEQTCNQPDAPGCLCVFFCTFTTSTSGCNVTLNWSTVSEPSNSSSFIIWRTSDATNWIQITTVNGNPGSTTRRNYSYTDNSPYNPQSHIYYYIQLVSYGNVINQTYIDPINLSSTSCPGSLGSLCTGTPIITGYSSPIALNATEQLTLTGSTPQTVLWTTSNPNVATVSASGLVTAVGYGTVNITGKYAVCNTSTSKNIVVAAPQYVPVPSPCNGISTSLTMTGNAGDVVVLKLSFGGYVSWNGISDGAGASATLYAGGQSNSAFSPHTYTNEGFSLNAQVTFTMPSNGIVSITTIAVVNNSSTMLSSSGTVTVVSVNGVSKNNQAIVCGGNSQGYW